MYLWTGEVSGLHMPLGFEFFGTLVLSDFFGFFVAIVRIEWKLVVSYVTIVS